MTQKNILGGINMEFYRYEIESRSHYGYDMDGNYTSSKLPPTITLELHEYVLYKETPKGYWICLEFWKNGGHGKRWISKTSRKRYAYPTKEEAMNNFLKRTEKRIKILKTQLYASEYGLHLANKLKENNYENK